MNIRKVTTTITTKELRKENKRIGISEIFIIVSAKGKKNTVFQKNLQEKKNERLRLKKINEMWLKVIYRKLKRKIKKVILMVVKIRLKRKILKN